MLLLTSQLANRSAASSPQPGLEFGPRANVYLFAIIGSGTLFLANALAHFPAVSPWSWTIYTALTVLASVVKVGLPDMAGTFSLGFVALLYGVAHFSLPETLVAGCAGALAQSIVEARLRPRFVQILFNAASTVVSLRACFFVGRLWPAGMTHYLPAAMSAVAAVYFIGNTSLVSFALSIFQRISLRVVCRQWYMWSFPCYLIGVVLAGLVPAPGGRISTEAWFILFPVVYLVHFFLGLAKWHISKPAGDDRSNAPFAHAARVYLISVVSTGLFLLTTLGLTWQSEDTTRFLIYLAIAVFASTLKIRLLTCRVRCHPRS